MRPPQNLAVSAAVGDCTAVVVADRRGAPLVDSLKRRSALRATSTSYASEFSDCRCGSSTRTRHNRLS
jgi:hypothetical protein